MEELGREIKGEMSGKTGLEYVEIPAGVHVLVDRIPEDSPLVELLDQLDVPFTVQEIEGLSDPELLVDDRRYWGLDEIAAYVGSRKQESDGNI